MERSKWINVSESLPLDQGMPENRGKHEFVIVCYVVPADTIHIGRLYFSIGIFTVEQGWTIQGSQHDIYSVIFWRSLDDMMYDLYRYFDERAKEYGFSVEYIKT